jgi:hypothetical protein
MSTTYLIHRVRTRFALFALALFNFLLVACGSLVSGSTTTVPTSHSQLKPARHPTPVAKEPAGYAAGTNCACRYTGQGDDSDQWHPPASFCAPDPP